MFGKWPVGSFVKPFKKKGKKLRERKNMAKSG
jgi:hypothetical protein